MSKFLNINLGFNNEMAVEIDSNTVSNGAISIIGEPGSGKSVELQRIGAEVIKNGGTVVIISMHGTFADDQILDYYKPYFDKYCYHINRNQEGIPCPMFKQLEHMDGFTEDEQDVIDAVTNIVMEAIKLPILCKGGLREAISKVYMSKKYDELGFGAIGKALQTGAKKSMEVYERMSDLFSRTTFVQGDVFIKPQYINLFHLERYATNVQKHMMELLLSYIWRCGNAEQYKNNPIYLIVDECQNSASREEGALAQMMSEGRKFGINLVLSTQYVLTGSFKATQQRMTQAATMIYFKPSAQNRATIAKFINSASPDKWAITLSGLKRGHFVAVGNFLVDGIPVDYPIVVDSSVNTLKKYEKTPEELCKVTEPEDIIMTVNGDSYSY